MGTDDCFICEADLYVSDLSIFREKFTALLRSYDKKYGMEPTQLEIDLPQTFDTFVSKLLEKYPGGFVLLIDEYDFNLNSLVDNNDLFEQTKSDWSFKNTEREKVTFNELIGNNRYGSFDINKAGKSKDLSAGEKSAEPNNPKR